MYHFGVNVIIKELLINRWKRLAGVALKTSNSSYASGSAAAGRVAPITYTGSHLNKPSDHWRNLVESRRSSGSGQGSGSYPVGSSYGSYYKNMAARSKKIEQATTVTKLGELPVELKNILNKIENPSEKLEIERIARQSFSLELGFVDGLEKVADIRRDAEVEQKSWVAMVAREKLRNLGVARSRGHFSDAALTAAAA